MNENNKEYSLILLVFVVLAGFALAIFASIYASTYLAVIIVVATTYVTYVIKQDNPQAPKIFGNMFLDKGK